MKKSLLIEILVSLFAFSHLCLAQKEIGVFNTLAVGANIGTTGVGLDLSTSITKYFVVRGGVSYMPAFHLSTDIDALDGQRSVGKSLAPMNVEGNLKRVQGELSLSFYPFSKFPLFVSGGVFFGGPKLVSFSGHSDELAALRKEGFEVGLPIGDKILPVDENGNVVGGLKVSKLRPFLGVGYGRSLPTNRFSFLAELGVQLHGTPDVYTDYGTLSTNTETDPDDKFTNISEKLTIYPVLRLRLCGRLF